MEIHRIPTQNRSNTRLYPTSHRWNSDKHNNKRNNNSIRNSDNSTKIKSMSAKINRSKMSTYRECVVHAGIARARSYGEIVAHTRRQWPRWLQPSRCPTRSDLKKWDAEQRWLQPHPSIWRSKSRRYQTPVEQTRKKARNK